MENHEGSLGKRVALRNGGTWETQASFYRYLNIFAKEHHAYLNHLINHGFSPEDAIYDYLKRFPVPNQNFILKVIGDTPIMYKPAQPSYLTQNGQSEGPELRIYHIVCDEIISWDIPAVSIDDVFKKLNECDLRKSSIMPPRRPR